MFYQVFLRICATVFIFLASALNAGASDLVSTDWVQQNTHQKTLLIDLRNSEDFALGHLPNAINLPYNLLTREKDQISGFIITPNTFKKLVEARGIRNDHQLIFYSDWSFLESMRAYWVFDFFGHQNMKVLDGGIQAWENQGKPLQQETPALAKSQYIVEIQPEIMSTKFRTFMATQSDDSIIVDARDYQQFIGETSLTERKGHIPSAMNLPWFELVTDREITHAYDRIKASNLLLNYDQLKAKLDEIPQNKKVVLYCNGGQESSVLYFALKEMGRNAAVYDGSWFEWSRDKKMPIER